MLFTAFRFPLHICLFQCFYGVVCFGLIMGLPRCLKIINTSTVNCVVVLGMYLSAFAGFSTLSLFCLLTNSFSNIA
ncbi:hypothetical protein BVRB_4g082560 [Beta vulgaris subsp. vulgaris]|nr:hypothetical protein BVRB_4g082560 [Beta vulgaris subsp. vulgaris]